MGANLGPVAPFAILWHPGRNDAWVWPDQLSYLLSVAEQGLAWPRGWLGGKLQRRQQQQPSSGYRAQADPLCPSHPNITCSQSWKTGPNARSPWKRANKASFRRN